MIAKLMFMGSEVGRVVTNKSLTLEQVAHFANVDLEKHLEENGFPFMDTNDFYVEWE